MFLAFALRVPVVVKPFYIVTYLRAFPQLDLFLRVYRPLVLGAFGRWWRCELDQLLTLYR
jgi:hypothetical protein